MICEETTDASNASIAWAIEPTEGSRFRIVIRYVTIDGVDIDAKTFTQETIECLRDIVRESSEYDADWLSSQAKDWNHAVWEDRRDDNRMDEQRISGA